MCDINLKQIIEQFPDCITNGAKLKAILLDLYPEISKAIVNTLVIMANSGIAKEIHDSKNVNELDKSRWINKLENDYGLSEKFTSQCVELLSCKYLISQIKEKLSPEIIQPSKKDFEIEDGVLIEYNGESTKVVIPNGVVAIGDFAFTLCSEITEITIPKTVKSIGHNAFWHCANLNSVKIPYSVMNIDDNAFEDCPKLKTIYYEGADYEWDEINRGDWRKYGNNCTVVYYA